MRSILLRITAVLLASALTVPPPLLAARPVGAAGAPVQAVPIPAPAPGVTFEEIQETWESLYGVLFGAGFDADTVQFGLDTAVLGPGQFTGQNESGSPYDLDVTGSTALDLTTLGLSPAALQEAIDQNMTWHMVEAVASTANGSMALHGMCLSRQSSTVPFQSIFFPLVEQGTTIAALQEGGEVHGWVLICIAIPVYCNDDPEACAEDCEDAYDDAVEAAHAAADAAEAEENETHAGIVDEIQDDWGDAIDLANTNFDTDMTACAIGGTGGALASLALLFIPGIGPLVGGAGIAATATWLADCQITAWRDRERAKNEANSLYGGLLSDENDRHEDALQDIAQQLQEDLDAAQQALSDCLDGCYEICWEIYCFYWEY